MALKFFGPNRMAAQQGVEDSGSSLVRQRPSWGMGPQGMPGSFDYDSSGMESKRGGQGGWGVKEPNAYERGGFFWNGSGVSQGTPIAHQDQRMRLAENEDVRRYAQQALDDKKHNLNVRDVDSRIRMADRSFDESVRQGDRRFGLDERKLGEDVRIADRGFDENVRQADKGFGLKERELDDRKQEREHDLGVRNQQERKKGIASSNPERFISFFDQATGGKAYAEGFGALNGKPNLSMEATQFVNRVDQLAMHPRLQGLGEEALAQLALQKELRWNGDQLFALSEQGWRPVNIPAPARQPAGVR